MKLNSILTTSALTYIVAASAIANEPFCGYQDPNMPRLYSALKAKTKIPNNYKNMDLKKLERT